MKRRNLIFLFLLTFFLALPAFVFAVSKSQVIFSLDVLADPIYQTSPNQWQIVNNADENLYIQDDGSILFNGDGEFTLVYPITFGYQNFDKLVISLSTDILTEVRLVPDVETTALTSEQFEKIIFPSQDFQEINYSLRHRFFKDVKENIGITFQTSQSAQIKIKEIRLEKGGPVEIVSQVVIDYFKPARYLPFTVNLFPAPLIFGNSAMVYFLPFVVLALILFLRTRKWQKKAAIFLLVIFFLTDFRMAYEFLNYHITDYKTFVKPAAEEKVFRNYTNFYSFADWLGQALPADTGSINFFSLGSADFYRILHYELYPLNVNDKSLPSQTYAIFNRSDIRFSAHDKVLFDSDGPITAAGELVDIFDENSFIFKEN